MADLNSVIYNKLGELDYMGTLNDRMLKFFSEYVPPGGDVAWGDIVDKPTTFPPEIGTTATTAKAGNWNPAISEVTGLQDVLEGMLHETSEAPATSTSPGTKGSYFMTPDNLYICIATDTWRAVTLSWPA